jgi:hypothetical protein
MPTLYAVIDLQTNEILYCKYDNLEIEGCIVKEMFYNNETKQFYI